LYRQPLSATRERLPESGELVSSFYDYWRCPKCGVAFATARKEDKS
jgi:hypothetical protein